MMFVSGETAEPSAETTGMIEELVKQQVIEMVSLLILFPHDLNEPPGFPTRPPKYAADNLAAHPSNCFGQSSRSAINISG
jgi:Transcription initiation factor IID, 18kD subunit